MNISQTTFVATELRSLSWDGEVLVDWVAGARYHPDGTREEMNIGSGYRFDAAVGMGSVGVSFEALGTKGRVLRDNGARAQGNWHPLSVDIIREINRSYYRADAYFYPVTLFRLSDGREVIAHCPRGYEILDIEDIDGTCLTPRPTLEASDIFHARLEASTDGKWLLSNGWVWAPWNVACVYNVETALAEPTYLSTSGEKIDLGADWEWEIEGATFAGHRLICLTSMEKAALTIYDLDSRRHETLIVLDEPPGSRLMAVGSDHVVLFDGTPRLLQLSTGVVIHRWEDLDGGKGLWQPSVSICPPAPPFLATDPERNRFALGSPHAIVVVSVTL